MAIESIQSIRTVFELSRQKSFGDRYAKLVDESMKYEALCANGTPVVLFVFLTYF
jgi:hypothetical protein